MARKRRAPSPPPPPPPPQESSSAEESGSETEEEGEPPRSAAAQKPPLNPRPPPTAAAADSSEEESESDADADAQAFQMRPVARSPTKPAPPAPQPGSDADEVEEGESSESEPETPEPAPKKAAAAAAAAKKAKAEQEDKKRPAPEPAPSGKAKKAKADEGKAASDATPTGKAKKAKAAPEKATSEPIPSGKAKKPALDPTPSGKSEKRAPRTWTKDDLIKILETLAAHVKSEGTLLKTESLIAAVGDRLDRKNCSYADMYEKVRRLKERYEKAVSTGVVPTKEDELRMYNLSEAVWGEKAKEAIAATASQNDGTQKKSKKTQGSKDTKAGNSNGGAPKESSTKVADQNGDVQKGSKRGQAIGEKADTDVKSRLSKKATSTATMSKKGNHKGELGGDAKRGMSEETTTGPAQNGDALAKRKRGKTGKENMEGNMDSLVPKVATNATQNGEGTLEEDTEKDADVQGIHRGFDELQKLYPNLAAFVERIETQHPCGETLKRAFDFIGDEKAHALESKIKTHRVLEVKAQIRRGDIKKEVLNILIGLAD